MTFVFFETSRLFLRTRHGSNVCILSRNSSTVALDSLVVRPLKYFKVVGLNYSNLSASALGWPFASECQCMVRKLSEDIRQRFTAS